MGVEGEEAATSELHGADGSLPVVVFKFAEETETTPPQIR